MAKKYLTKKQLAVIDEFFRGELSEDLILKKHRLSRGIYNRWLGDELFQQEYKRRIRGARLQSEALMARYSLLAAVKLVELTESKKEETARKACMTIISVPCADEKARPKKQIDPETPQQVEDELLEPEVCEKLLAALTLDE